MSTPSFSSFPPSFTSFPETNPGPSKQFEHEEDLSSKSKNIKGKRRAKKRKLGADPYSASEVQPSGSKSSETQEDIRFPQNEILTRSFYSDFKGDLLNIRYGGLHKGDIPKYKLVSRGRYVLGLPHGWVATFRSGRGVEVTPRTHSIASGLTDSKTRALLAAPPIHINAQSGSSHKYEEIDGFLRLSSGHTSSHEPSYRSIIPSKDPDGDSESSSASESDDDNSDNSDALALTAHQETLKMLDYQITADPSSVKHWLLLLSHTLSTVPTTSKNAAKARCEIALSILNRAISADARNGVSKVLRLKYMKAGEEIWHESKVRAEWEDALKVGGAEIWIEWFEWKIGKGNRGVDGIVEDATRVLSALGIDENDEMTKLRVFWRVTVAFQNAGFPERATAMFQAQAELTFRIPLVFRELPLRARIKELEGFWESEAPRVGEEGAQGWAIWISSDQEQLPPRKSNNLTWNSSELDPYRQWSAWESHADQTTAMPTRSAEEPLGTDPYSIILFTDIQPFLLDLQSPRSKDAFRLIWLSVMGLHMPGFSLSPPNTDGINWDDRWSHGHLRRSSYLDALFPHDATQTRLATDAVAGVIIGREKEYVSGFGPVRCWAHGIFEPLNTAVGNSGSDVNKGVVSIWDKKDLDKLNEEVVRRIFSQLRLGPNDSEWDILALAFEAAINMKSAVKHSRILLSTLRESIPHWAAHARLERARGRVDDARKVYQTILIASAPSKSKGQGSMWWDWAEMEWLEGGYNQALNVVLRSIGGGGGQGGVAILRCKRSLQDVIEQETQWKEREAWVKLRALLELLAANEVSGALEVFDEHLSRIKADPIACESLTVACLIMLYRYSVVLKNPMQPVVLRERVIKGVDKYPSNSVILGLFLEGEKGQGIWGRVRRILGDNGENAKSIARRVEEVWLAGWERGRWKSEIERTRNGLAAAVENERTRPSHVLWRIYLEFEIRAGHLQQAKKLLFRAIGECPLVKELYLLAFGPLRGVFSAQELNGIADIMAERGLRLWKGLDEVLAGWVREEQGEEESVDSIEDEIEENAKELRRLMPY